MPRAKMPAGRIPKKPKPTARKRRRLTARTPDPMRKVKSMSVRSGTGSFY